MKGVLIIREDGCDVVGPHGDKDVCESEKEETCIEEHPRDIKLCDKRMPV